MNLTLYTLYTCIEDIITDNLDKVIAVGKMVGKRPHGQSSLWSIITIITISKKIANDISDRQIDYVNNDENSHSHTFLEFRSTSITNVVVKNRIDNRIE